MTNDNEEGRRAANLELVEKFFSPDVSSDDWIDLFAVDGLKEVPFALPDMAHEWDGHAGLKESRRINSGRKWSGVTHLDLEIHPTTDPDVFFALSHVDAMLADRPYVQSYIHMLRFQDGKVVLYREWFNPLQLLESRGGKIVLAEGDTFANPAA